MDHVEAPLHILLVEKKGRPISPPTYLHSLFIHFLFEFYIGMEGKESMMDHIERKGRSLIPLALYWCLHMILQHVFDMQALALNEEWKNALILSICFESMKMSDRSVWAFERNIGFTDRLLLGSFTEKNIQTKNLCMSQHNQVSL